MGTRATTSAFQAGGPCPPSGDPHRYMFKVYAMDIQVGLAPVAMKEDLLSAINAHILDQGQLMGPANNGDPGLAML